jgi:hypothetical protein
MIQYIDECDILKGENGDILIMINSLGKYPEEPIFYYDGNDIAILKYSSSLCLVFRDIANECSLPLINAKEIRILELEDETIMSEYTAKLCVK